MVEVVASDSVQADVERRTRKDILRVVADKSRLALTDRRQNLVIELVELRLELLQRS